MTSQGFHLAPGEVRALSGFIQDVAAKNLRSALDSVASDVDSTVPGSWRGDAADEFVAGWTEAHDGGVKILEALTNMGELVGSNTESYLVTERGSASAISSDQP